MKDTLDYDNLPKENREEAFINPSFSTNDYFIYLKIASKVTLDSIGFLIVFQMKINSKLKFIVNHCYPFNPTVLIPNEVNGIFFAKNTNTQIDISSKGLSSISDKYTYLFQIEKVIDFSILIQNN